MGELVEETGLANGADVAQKAARKYGDARQGNLGPQPNEHPPK